MKFLTFNIRCDHGQDGANSFQFRKQMILETIREEEPFVIGFQEVLPHVFIWLTLNLPDYWVVGKGRGRRLGGERVAVAIRKRGFQLLSFETFWLSSNPEKPGSRFFLQSPWPRICTHVRLRAEEDGRIIHIYNTHLDHISFKAREYGLRLLAERIKKDRGGRSEPVVLMGDFNAQPGSRELKPLKALPWLMDGTAHLLYSYHRYGRLLQSGKAKKLDYVYLSAEFSIKKAYPIDNERNGVYLSDHFPLAVECVLP